MRSDTLQHREQKIIEFYPLVRTIARRMSYRLPSTVDVEELVSVGMLGLIEAVDRFDTERGVPLKAYAEIRIKGAMVDSLRSGDWVPRAVRQRSQQLQQARESLRGRSGEATPSKMAAALGMDLREYDAFVRDSQIRALISLDAPLQEEGAPLVEQVSDGHEDAEDALSRAQIQEMIDAALTELDPQEREAVSLSFLQGHTLREIGGMMGVTESRVCQIRTQAVRRLRRRLQPALAC